VADNSIIFVNPAFTTLTGYTPEEAIGRNCRFLQGPDTDRETVSEIREAIAAGRSIRREILNYRKDGEPFWNDLMIDPIRDDAGFVTGFVGIQYKTAAGTRARAAQAEAELRLKNIIDNLPGYIFRRVLRPDGTIVAPYVGALVSGILGKAEGTATAEDFYRHIHPEDQARFARAIARSAADLSLFNEDFRVVSEDGALHWFRSVAPPRRMPNNDIIWDGFALDITAEKAAETQLAFMAFHDSLTGLSNRARFRNSLRKAIDSIASDGDRLEIFFIDLDAFEEVNDTFGYAVGNDVLRSVAQRLEVFAEDGGGIVARLGGDEFAVLLADVAVACSTADLAESIGAALSRPMQLSGHDIVLEVCVGAAVFPHPAEGAPPAVADACRELMQQADLALRAAKQQGPGAHRIYAAEFDDRNRNRMALRQSLGRAVKERHFVLNYQPLIELASGRIVAAEALVRWNHPELGLQRPDLFIPLAEASGLIVPLGAWIMEEAMRCAQSWRKNGIDTPRIAINVSSVQLQKPGFIASVEQALAATGADPCDFEFELTESVLIEFSTDMLSTLNALKSLGFSIAIDDFGTGHSTFKYLRDFPVDKIKIDQTFIRTLVIDSSDAVIVRAMIALARNLGIQIVAEGIETRMQRDFLRDEGCTLGQGYLFSMPLAEEDFGWMLENRPTLPMGFQYPEPSHPTIESPAS
jgi:diguanylate cyclase (GGDEF)-like protein/PAS domain S-box-containing protein